MFEVITNIKSMAIFLYRYYTENYLKLAKMIKKPSSKFESYMHKCDIPQPEHLPSLNKSKGHFF